ncbi:hypothetical protein OC842_000823 [Tilletia horrida]|uniref:Urea transporter n=1 Tax=Tilletia horrida TaxID=155126 RepID=A0AAN6JTS7_9BASI|nr:hypothetical protein OC842_000823 [Tilletia horrida]
MSDSSSTQLSLTQGNALVYTTLSAFFLVGLYAGYRCKTERDFLSGLRTQGTLALTLNWIASNMSSSLLFGYPQLAVIPGAGLLGLTAYAFSTVVPLWAFAFLGPYIRRVAPEGFTLAQFIRVRFGNAVGILSALVFCGFMLCFMITELNTYGSVVNLLAGVNPTVAALIIAISTTIYTAYGGFKASLWTDNVNAVVISIFLIMMVIAVGVKIDVDPQRVQDSGLLKADKLGGELWYILTVALLFSQMLNQGFWQRAFASRDNRTLYKSVIFATVPLFAICFLVGMAGPLTWWSTLNLFNGPTAEDDGSLAVFTILSTLPTWCSGIVIVLAGALSSSAYDTFQSAQISTIQNDVFLGKVNIWFCRAILIALNVPAIILAVRNVDILEVFLIADLGAAAALPAPLLGLIPQLWWLNGFDVFVGACGGFFTVFLFGTAFYHGDAVAGGKLITLPEGLYIEDYSVLGAFLAAPIGSIGWTFIAFAFRLGALWAGAKLFRSHQGTGTGAESAKGGKPGAWIVAAYDDVFVRKEWDARKFVLEEDRVLSAEEVEQLKGRDSAGPSASVQELGQAPAGAGAVGSPLRHGAAVPPTERSVEEDDAASIKNSSSVGEAAK